MHDNVCCGGAGACVGETLKKGKPTDAISVLRAIDIHVTFLPPWQLRPRSGLGSLLEFQVEDQLARGAIAID